MKTSLIFGGVLLLAMAAMPGLARADDIPAPSNLPESSAPADTADDADKGPSADKIDEQVSRFDGASEDERTKMMQKAVNRFDEMSSQDQAQLFAAQRERFAGMPQEQVEQELRDELKSMTPQQQASIKAQWAMQLQAEPGFKELGPKERLEALDKLRNFGDEPQQSPVLAPPPAPRAEN